MNALLWSTLVVLVVLGVLVQLRANRLDRLHIRTDAAAAGLRAALERRAVVARAVAALTPGPAGTELRAAADQAEGAEPTERESAENELTRALAAVTGVPDGLRAELVDAEQRVLIARRVHNDAVRDTLALRGTRLVRWFRLAGTAAAPRYFEIAEDPLTTRVAAVIRRTAARVVLLDDSGRVLLLEGVDPARPDEPYWFTLGGGVDAGEDLRAAAARELHEEIGLRMDAGALVGPVWRRDVRFEWDGVDHEAREWFFVAHTGPPADPGSDPVPGTVPDGLRFGAGFTELERASVRRHRWWSVEELRETTEVVHPVRLADLLPDAGDGWDGVTRTIG
jgi:8-oxo-dGTP pyrophosphatase MutT (NUDIX family)